MGQVNLHNHSEGSFLDGYANVADIASRAKELGQEAIAITDHGECNQHLAFQKACAAEGVKPLFGMEGYHTNSISEAKTFKKFSAAPVSHICLIAKDQKGLENLWAWSTVAYDKDHHWYKPIADPELMRTYAEGIYGSDGCMLTTFSTAIENDRDDEARAFLGQLLDIFEDRFYMELHTWQFLEPQNDEERRLNKLMTKINQAKVRYANELGVPLVVVNDSHHARPQDWQNKDLVWSINTGSLDQFGSGGQKADHIMGEDELFVYMARHGIGRSVVEECIRNSAAIAESCNVDIKATLDLPQFTTSERDDMAKFIDLVEEGFRHKVVERGLDIDLYYQRLHTECKLICEKKFCGYFLVVNDYVKAARTGSYIQYIKPGADKDPCQCGPGRGSGGGSLVAWLLDITALDPIRHGLLFERFLAPARKGYPDIDNDFPQSKRPGLKAYLEARWGQDQVCSIGTITRNNAKGMLRDLGKVMDVPYMDREAMSKIIVEAAALVKEEQDDNEDEGLGWDEIVSEKGGDLAPWARKYPELFEKLGEMVGVARQSGVHPSGVLVNAEPLLGKIPMRTRKHNTKDQITTTQFDMWEVEELGGVKFDILGIRHLDTLEHLKKLLAEEGTELVFEDLTEEQLAEPGVWEQVDKGQTTGVFQVETPGATRDGIDFKPRHLHDLRDLLSIIRPGVADAGLKDQYLRRRAGVENVVFDHPLMEEITGETEGILVYQEQLFLTVQRCANFTIDEAYDLVKIVGKKQAEKLIPLEEKFVNGCMDNREFMKAFGPENCRDQQDAINQAEATAHKIWNSIKASGRYAFGKAHATGYGLLGNWELYAKDHYKPKLITALLATDGANTRRYVRDARRNGINVLPPDVNQSSREFTIDAEGDIRYGIEAIKGIGSAMARDIMAARPYTSLEDFLARAGRGSNHDAVMRLLKVGAMDSFGDRTVLMQAYERLRMMEGLAESTLNNSLKLDATIARRYTEHPERWCLEIPDFADEKVLAEIEEELLGNVVTVDPMERYAKALDAIAIRHPDDMRSFQTNEPFVVGGLVTRIKTHTVGKGRSKGQEMAFVNIQHNEEDFDVVVFSDKWTQVKTVLKEGSPVACSVTRTDRGCSLVGVERLDLLWSSQ